jgi:hypothetical protein
MNQDPTNQETTTQETLAGGGGNSGTGFATGTTCTSSGTYRCSNKYMDVIAIFAAGDIFLKGPDGKNTTWVRLTTTLSSNKGGSFEGVKVPAGTL